jgi:hypothetical protein
MASVRHLILFFGFLLIQINFNLSSPPCNPGLSNYQAFGDFWLFISTGRAQHAQAKAACQADGATLAIPNNPTIFRAIDDTNADIWIGLENPTLVNCFDNAECAAVPLKWADGSDAIDLATMADGIAFVNDHAKCLRQIPSGYFYDISCANLYRYACQYTCPPPAAGNGLKTLSFMTVTHPSSLYVK